VIAEHFCRKFR